MIMKTLKESLLGDLDANLAKGDNIQHLDELPTINDFVKYPHFDKIWHAATWYCPDIVSVFRTKYSDYHIPHDADSISVVLIPRTDRVVNCILKFSKCDNPPILYINIKGWEDGYVGSNIRKYKKMALDVLYKVAKDYNKLSEMMEYSYKFYKFWSKVKSGTSNDKGTYLSIKQFNEL